MRRNKPEFVRSTAVPAVLAVLAALPVSVLFPSPVEALTCDSVDTTRTAGCYRTRTDQGLLRLLVGTESQPFDYPEVCGLVVDSVDLAREVLGSEECRSFRREALAAIFNIRRSILFGDGLVGGDSAGCYATGSFNIVLRCGSIFVPDLSTPDPDDAVSVSEETSVADLVDLSNELCRRAECPATADATCGSTIDKLAEILERFNQSRSKTGDDDDPSCSLCPGDSTPPVMSCPSGLLTFECQSPEGAAIEYRVTATDDCDPGPLVTCFPPPGTVLPVGERRTVQCTAEDLRGNTSSCSFEVLVLDTTPPVIHCPDTPLVVDCTPGTPDGAVVNYPVPVATDICDADPTVVCDPPSGGFFPFGTTVVTCKATDDSGNQSTCTFEVQVVEQTPAELLCPASITTECTGHDGTAVTYPPPMFSDTCDPPEEAVCEPPSGSLFPLGMTTVTCRTLDLDGTPIQCEFDVRVVDTQPPLILCPENRVVECATPSGTAVLFDVTATDVCDAAPVVTTTPPSGTVFPPGITTVVCTARDASGNESSCQFTVTVNDTTPPELTCPQGPITVACTVSGPESGAVVNYAGPAVTDNCDPSPTVTCDRPSGSVFPLGSTTVTCTATDDSLNESTCSFEVRVVDDAAPELVCISDLVRECDGPDGAIVDYPLPVAADECTGDLTIACIPPSGSLFPIGTTPVTCTATDPSGNVSECTFNITVEDSTPPALQCPADKVAECATMEGTRVTYEVLAVDTCDPEPAVTCDPPSGSIFPPGATAVRCTATDRFGNSSTCSFTVSVVDTTPPAITCPEPVTVECATPEGAMAAFTASALDDCDGTVAVLCDPPSGTVFPPGRSTVVCTATDSSGNTSRCEFPVDVVDTTPPSITCAQDAVVVECDQLTGGTVQYPLPAVSDACDPLPTVSCDPAPGSVLPLGRNTVTCTARDSSGNTASCTFVIEVVDTAPPSLVCVDDITRECTGPDGAIVDYPFPMATDTCDAAPNLSCLPPPGSVFPIGVTEVTCTADDRSGNLIRCSFNVSVVDTTPPVIQCPGDVTASCSSPEGAQVSFVALATDTCDPTPTVSCEPPSGSTFPLGATTVRCTAVDRAGNSSTCEFVVTVVDQSPPNISCPKDFETECMEGGMATVVYPPPSVTDACDPSPVVVCDPPSGSSFPPGNHVISCTATDASGNTSSCEFTVGVVDTTAPALICPPARTVECQGPDGAIVDYALPVANDACEGQPLFECVPPPGSLFPLGSTEVVCRSSDSLGNSTQCSVVITVVDTTSPVIECPGPITAECASAEGAVVEFETAVTDLCDPAPVVVCDPPSGSVFPRGLTAVTCRATDASGNSSECTFSVTVVDTTPPDVVCPDDMIVECPVTEATPNFPPGTGLRPESCSTVVSYPPPEASDACRSDSLQVTCTPPSGSRLELGVHTVTCRVRDPSGNETSCSFDIEVVPDRKPMIRGDANSDTDFDIADPIYVVRFLFIGGEEPECLDGADGNDDGDVNIGDAIYLLGYQFQGGPPPPDPFAPLCGFDLSEDTLGCERYRPCE